MWNVWRWLRLNRGMCGDGLGLNVECVEMVGAECGVCGDGWGLNVECVEMFGG